MKVLEEAFYSIIAECKRKLSVEVFGASTKMVDSEVRTTSRTGEVRKEKGM